MTPRPGCLQPTRCWRRPRTDVPHSIRDRRLVRNVYKVLLTRGLSGTIIYSPDEETRDKLRSLIESR